MKKFDVKQDVVNRIIEKFETVGEFEMPFKTFGTQNFKTGHRYRGINILLLAMAGYSSPYWGTPKQWIEAGADISGSKCTKIVFWKIKKYEDEESGEEKTVAWAKYYNVLNAEQVTGWEAPVADQKMKLRKLSRLMRSLITLVSRQTKLLVVVLTTPLKQTPLECQLVMILIQPKLPRQLRLTILLWLMRMFMRLCTNLVATET